MNTSIAVLKTASSEKSKLINMFSLLDHNNTTVKRANTNNWPGLKGKLLLLVVAFSRCLQIRTVV